jgi:hypothetical protein
LAPASRGALQNIGPPPPPSPPKPMHVCPDGHSVLAAQSWKPPAAHDEAHEVLNPPAPPRPAQHTWPFEQLAALWQAIEAEPSGQEAAQLPPPALRQHVCPEGHPDIAQPNPPSVMPPEDELAVPDEVPVPDDVPPDPSSPDTPPLLPLPPLSALLPPFDVDPPQAAARARPRETENHAARVFIGGLLLSSSGRQGTSASPSAAVSRGSRLGHRGAVF